MTVASLMFSSKAKVLLLALQNKNAHIHLNNLTDNKYFKRILKLIKRSYLKKLSNEIVNYVVNFLSHDEKLLKKFLEQLEKMLRKRRKLLLRKMEALKEEEEQELLQKLQKIRKFNLI